MRAVDLKEVCKTNSGLSSALALAIGRAPTVRKEVLVYAD